MSCSPEQLIITSSLTSKVDFRPIYMLGILELISLNSGIETIGEIIKMSHSPEQLIITSSLSRFWSFSIASMYFLKQGSLLLEGGWVPSHINWRLWNLSVWISVSKLRKNYRQMIKIGDLSSTTFKVFKLSRCCPKQTLHCFTHQGVHFPLQILLPACLK